MTALYDIAVLACRHWRTSTAVLLPYLPVAGAFAVFLQWNKGIVLGKL